MLTAFDAILLGIVEGITEFLPISSTGHLILAGDIFKINQTEFTKSFDIAIQLGAILSVVVLYWKSIFLDLKIIQKIIVAFIPTAILGAIFYKLIKSFLLENDWIIVYSLLIGGVILILFELWHKEKESHVSEISQMSFKQVALIGLFQSVAMVPGISRSAATIIGGLILGIKRKTIVEFSFLLAAPTMFAATVLDLAKSGSSFTFSQFEILFIGFIVSFVVAILAIKFLLSFIKNHTFILFGVYRIVLALFFIIFILK